MNDTPKTQRQIVVVDTETNGLDPARHVAVEVAWINLTTGDSGVFVPRHNVSEVLAAADNQALQINRYVDRLALAKQDANGNDAYQFAEQLHGNTLAGSNPTFDAAFLTEMYRRYDDEVDGPGQPGWHHRLLDLSAYAAGVLGISPAELPGLSTVCDLLGVENVAPHTALEDAIATAECFRRLFAKVAGSAGEVATP